MLQHTLVNVWIVCKGVNISVSNMVDGSGLFPGRYSHVVFHYYIHISSGTCQPTNSGSAKAKI
jgi:hypothetical protein